MVGPGGWEARTFAAACMVAGLALGFVLVGLVTEPLEGAVGFPALPLVKTLLLVLTAVLLAGQAWLRRGAADAPFWSALATGAPAWFAFYEGGAAEAHVGIGLTLAATWACLGLAGAPSRIALLLASALAWLLSPWPGLQAWAGASTLLLAAACLLPTRARRYVAPAGAATWCLLTAALAWPGAVAQADRGDLETLVAGLAAIALTVAVAVVAPLAAARHRAM